MPSDRRQLNVRLSDEGSVRFDRLEKEIADESGTKHTQAQIIEMALAALEEKMAVCKARKVKK